MIADGKQVSLEYTLKLDDGSTADTNVGRDPLVYQHGEGQILPALEAELAGMGVNDTKQVTLTADDGYGPVDPEAFQEVPLEAVPEDAREVNTMLVARTPEGEERAVRVHAVADDQITLDFNHPLAGETLHFDVTIVAIA